MVRAFRHVWFAGMYEFDLVLLLLQQMCVFLVIAWLMSKTRLFIPLMQVTVRLPHKLLCYVTFSIFCIMGTYFGLHIEDSIANTRAIGAVMGGLLGGPVVGGLVGLTGGLHRYSLGGMTGWQRLYKVELPLAAPVILAGIRTSVIVNIGTATIASTVGASTLGTPIIIGLSGFNTAYIVQGALLVALAAIIVDRAFERLTRWISRHRHAQ